MWGSSRRLQVFYEIPGSGVVLYMIGKHALRSITCPKFVNIGFRTKEFQDAYRHASNKENHRSKDAIISKLIVHS